MSSNNRSKSLSKGIVSTIITKPQLYLTLFDHKSFSSLLVIHNRCDTVTQNVPGTDSYWRSAFFEFEATSLQQSHGYKKTPQLFHTGSMAEFHEYDLRCLLAIYVLTLTKFSQRHAEEKATAIMTDDSAFVEAVQTYKNVVTHYFAAKTEIWMALFMSPVFGVEGGNLSMEFAKSRGCIHFHSVLQAAHRALRIGSDELRNYAKTISESMKTIDQFIDGHWTSQHNAEFPTRPSKVYSQAGLELRERFCSKTQEGKAIMDQYHRFATGSASWVGLKITIRIKHFEATYSIMKPKQHILANFNFHQSDGSAGHNDSRR